MTDPPEPDPRERASGLDDPTRDIRSLPLPGAPAAAPPDAVRTDQPTGRLGPPPEQGRDRTLTFDGTSAQRWAAGHAATPDPAWTSVPALPGPVVGPRPREAGERRWPWIVLTLVPVLVIVTTGVWLLVLVRSG